MMNCPMPNQNPMPDDCMCENKLEITKICAKCAKICFLKAKHLWAEDLAINNICAQDVMSQSSEVNQLTVNSECAQSISAVAVNASSILADNACLSNATINNLCVTNLSAPNFNICNTIRAYLGLNAPYTYVLGSNLTFNNVLDDPSGISSQVPTTHFTAAVAGYYNISMFLNLTNLQGAAIITGIPVAQLSILVNGVSKASTLIPFLSFNNEIADTIAANLLLQVGDQVTAELNVLVLTTGSGLTNYVGSMDVQGSPATSFVDPSTFNIVLISTLCSSSGVTPVCIPCQPVPMPCQPVAIPCTPVRVPQCDPCQ